MTILILLILLLLFMIFWQVSLIYATFLGAPTVYSHKKAMVEAFELAGLKKGELVVDLGCGNARSLIIAAKHFGARGVGVERSPYAYLQSILMVRLSGQQDKIKILFGDFKVAEDYLKKADVVYLYLLNSVLSKLEDWFFATIPSETRVVSLSFLFSKHKPAKEISVRNLGRDTFVRLYEKS